jgi:hypothetical protein
VEWCALYGVCFCCIEGCKAEDPHIEWDNGRGSRGNAVDTAGANASSLEAYLGTTQSCLSPDIPTFIFQPPNPTSPYSLSKKLMVIASS